MAANFFAPSRGRSSPVEGLDVRPLQPHHVEGQLRVRRIHVPDSLSQPRFQPRAEVAQRERLRGAVGEIGAHQGVESGAAQDRLQAREILFKEE